ncbi:hypothetical protein ILYODFUR_018948, partial [Ilyodon furcidens]
MQMETYLQVGHNDEKNMWWIQGESFKPRTLYCLSSMVVVAPCHGTLYLPMKQVNCKRDGLMKKGEYVQAGHSDKKYDWMGQGKVFKHKHTVLSNMVAVASCCR